MIELRDYQQTLVADVSQAFRAGAHGVVMQSATGSGKTRTAAYIVSRYAQAGKRVLWVVHRDELLLQACMTFALYQIPHRTICSASSARAIACEEFREFGRSWVNPMAGVTAASIQTLVRRLDKIREDYDLIIVDEAHLSLAKSYRDTAARWPSARILGLTATPVRTDGQAFARADGGLYDEIVAGPSVAHLMDIGALADYELYAPPMGFDVKPGKIKMRGGDFDPAALAAEFDKPILYGNAVDHYHKYSHGLPAIGFAPTVQVSENFAARFRGAGYRAIALDGQTDAGIRRRSLQQLAEGELDVIMSVGILIEGTDVPLATTAIMLRKTTSTAVYLQSVGRVLRPHPQKRVAKILDLVGVSKMHGYPDDDREWSLDGASSGRKKQGETDEGVTVCPACFRQHRPAPECPGCGHKYTPKERAQMQEVASDLIIVSRADRERLRAEREAEEQRMRDQKRAENRKAKTVEELIAIGRQRGYQYPEAWARKQFAIRQQKRKA